MQGAVEIRSDSSFEPHTPAPCLQLQSSSDHVSPAEEADTHPTMEPLAYTPIVDDDEIRLIEIQPGEGSDPMRLRIFHAHFDKDDGGDAPADVFCHEHRTSCGSNQTVVHVMNYEALSYVWGTQDNPESVFVHRGPPTIPADKSTLLPPTHEVPDYRPYPVGYNLATALRHLRYADCTRKIWIDALCINQIDLAERAAQVLRMGSIYRRAENVVAFLGPDDNGKTRNGLAMIGCINRNEDFGLWDKDSDIAASDRPIHLPWQIGLSLCQLLRREWFQRLWIRQEIAFGKRRAILQCGRHSILWERFSSAIDLLAEKNVITYCEETGIACGLFDQVFRTVGDDLVQAQLVASLHLADWPGLRIMLGASRCSDPRDRIFAVLDYLRSKGGPRIKAMVPDYTKPVGQIYTDTAWRIIRDSGNLRILSECDDTALCRQSGFGTPSWVPDWSTPMRSLIFIPPTSIYPSTGVVGVGNILSLLPAFAATENGDSHASQTSLLPVYGMSCAIVLRVVRKYGVSGSNGNNVKIVQELREFLRSAEQLYSSLAVDCFYPNLESRIDAYTRLVSVNGFDENEWPRNSLAPQHHDGVALVRSLLCKSNYTVGDDAPSDREAYRELAQEIAWDGYYSTLEVLLQQFHLGCLGRAMFITQDGRLGIGPASMQPADELALLFGLGAPVALRQVEQDGATKGVNEYDKNHKKADQRHKELRQQYNLIGTVFLDRHMQAEALFGPLPKTLRPVRHREDGANIGFLDLDTGRLIGTVSDMERKRKREEGGKGSEETEKENAKDGESLKETRGQNRFKKAAITDKARRGDQDSQDRVETEDWDPRIDSFIQRLVDRGGITVPGQGDAKMSTDKSRARRVLDQARERGTQGRWDLLKAVARAGYNVRQWNLI